MLLAGEAHRSNEASSQINDLARRIIGVSHGNKILGDDIAKVKHGQAREAHSLWAAAPISESRQPGPTTIQANYAGINSNVVALRFACLKPSTYFALAFVLYFEAYAASAASLSPELRTRTARTGTSLSSIRTPPHACERNARYQPSGLSFQERTTTRPSTTTTQIGIKRWSPVRM